MTVLGRYNESTKNSISESDRIVRLLKIVNPTPCEESTSSAGSGLLEPNYATEWILLQWESLLGEQDYEVYELTIREPESGSLLMGATESDLQMLKVCLFVHNG